ncbi:MAG TPA: YggS family pyridoxal phosphate-dependent enzyme [Acidimicrobiia bacterium]|nr:YggS family pyridoxal phosphate-dependent enzyme [Acidimicrobiia bacterium]
MSLESVRERMAAAARRSGRRVDQVTLIAVGKTHPVDVLMKAYDAGHRDFGENRASELAAKAAAMPADVRWHFIGPLQRNKVRLVRPVVRLLHSMDRLSLGEAWLKGPLIAPPALLEVNLADEPQKSGVAVDEAPGMMDQLLALGVDLRGVMAIPRQAEDPETNRPSFRRLARLRDELAGRYPVMRELSMGMTDDFEVAIEEGATMIRVGRAIFGPRVEH